jgi:hypothetical protein
VGGGCSSWRWGDFHGVGLQLRLATVDLRLQEDHGELRSGVLDLWRAAAEDGEICGTKVELFIPLFIVLSILTHRGCGVLHFLSINQTLIRLRLEDFG